MIFDIEVNGVHTCARANEELRTHLHADHDTGTPQIHMNT